MHVKLHKPGVNKIKATEKSVNVQLRPNINKTDLYLCEKQCGVASLCEILSN